MKILFLSLVKLDSILDRDIYTDLLREFISNGAEVFILSPIEGRKRQKGKMVAEDHSTILQVPTGNIQKTNRIEKGINTLLLGPRYRHAIRKYLKGSSFDLILYPTPPITLAPVVKWIKRRDGAFSYLLLKDIFPQNALDIGMLSESGFLGMVYSFFRRKEKQLYAISDRIGCMSQANCDYVLAHNPEIKKEKVELCPNCVTPRNLRADPKRREILRQIYELPKDRIVFVYGGNLGRPQGIPFLIQCLRVEKENPNVFFLIIGSGTEYKKLEIYLADSKQKNALLIPGLPGDEYEQLAGCCDVGLIFLDHRFTIPNFPSRLLSYMQAKLPVLAVTDPHTDIGQVITDGGFGWWCESDDADGFAKLVRQIPDFDLLSMGERAYDYMNRHYTAAMACRKILKSCGRV